MDLTEEQKKIVNHPINCHGRVLAGPGTGKSFTAVALVKKLYENTDHLPRIKFITFTRAATAELAKKIGTTAVPVENPSTLHSFSLGILIQNPGSVAFPIPLRIPSDFELNELIVPDLAKRLNFRKSAVEKLINWMAAKWESLSEGLNINISEQTRSQFSGLFELHRIIFGYTLLQEIPDLLRRALRDNQNLTGIDYEFIIVDEYQDLNACDLDIIKQLASRGIYILAIGDDDQSIYSGRCADPAGIRRFLLDFSTDKDYQLTVCHRCGKNILKWAQYVIAGDDTRVIPKTLRFTDTTPDGLTKLLRFRSNESETQGVAVMVKWLHKDKGVPYSEILILSRTDFHGAFSNPIKRIFMQDSIPISASNIDELLNEPNIVKGLSLLRLIEDENDSLAWWTLLHKTNNIGRTFIDSIYQKARAQSAMFGSVFKELINNHHQELPKRGKHEAKQLIEQVNSFLQQIQIPQESPRHWGQWIVNLMRSGQLPDGSDEFKEMLLKIDTMIEHDSSLGRFISQIRPLGKDIANSENKGVRFMTMMGSKGLTVQATIVVGVDNDLVPKINADLSEEHRLLYVAMTRSIDYLFLTWSGQRRGQTARAGRINLLGRRQPSKFLEHGPVESEDGDAFIKSFSDIHD